MKTLPLILIFLLTISSRCGTDDSNSFGNTESGYELTIGKEFTIELPSNPTTGYSWKWTNKQAVSIVDSIGYEYAADTPQLTGRGGKELWKFKGIRKGTDTLKFEYNRSWEPNSTVKTQNIAVKVK